MCAASAVARPSLEHVARQRWMYTTCTGQFKVYSSQFFLTTHAVSNTYPTQCLHMNVKCKVHITQNEMFVPYCAAMWVCTTTQSC